MHTNGIWTVLVLGDDPVHALAMARSLQVDYRLLIAGSERDAQQMLGSEVVDLMLYGSARRTDSLIDFFCRLRVTHPDVLRLAMVGSIDGASMSRLIRDAAVYQVLPVDWGQEGLPLGVKRALESRELARRHRYLSRELKIPDAALRRPVEHGRTGHGEVARFGGLHYVSEGMAEICELARRAAATDLPVLIQGETGTGKELMARALHASSFRSEFPFLAQNCGALPDELLHSELFGHKRGAFTGATGDRLGLFPAADGGTVFLDEISDVSPSFQASLLRFLQEGEVKPLGTHQTRHCNVRIIAASNQNLETLVASGKFRRDLYYRLRGFELNIPPLRERVEDIAVLAAHAATRYAESIRRRIGGISPDVLRRFESYAFPGNVRELENEVRRMVALAADGETLSVRLMSPSFTRLPLTVPRASAPGGQGTLKERVESLEKQLVSRSLHRHNGNQSRAASELGLSRVGLANKVRRYKLEGASTRMPSGESRKDSLH